MNMDSIIKSITDNTLKAIADLELSAPVIEKTLGRIADTLERIAVALEDADGPGE